MYLDLPLEVWSRVVTHADPVSTGILYDVSVGLRREVMERLRAHPTTIEQAMKADVPILMRTALHENCTDFEIKILIDLAYAERSWRVLVHCLARHSSTYACSKLINGGCFGQAAMVSRDSEDIRLNGPVHWALQLYMTRDPEPRSQVLSNILSDCAYGYQRMREYLEVVHARDIPNLLQSALDNEFPFRSLCDVFSLKRRKIIQYYLLQCSVGKLTNRK